MTMTTRSTLATAVAGAVLLFLAPAASAMDEKAAKSFFKENDCTKCHAPAKSKKGPSLKKIAQDNKGKADYEEKMIKHMTSSPKVKLDDGTEEEHKKLDADPATLKNLVQYIMSHQ